MRRVLAILVSGILALLAVFTGIWGWKTLTIPQPYDEVWIELNTRVPGPLRGWACQHVKARTGAAIPPLGCEGRW